MLKISNLKSCKINILKNILKSINKTITTAENKKTVKLHIVKNDFSYDFYKIDGMISVYVYN